MRSNYRQSRCYRCYQSWSLRVLEDDMMAGTNGAMKDRVLIVAKDDGFKIRLAEMLEATGDYLAVGTTTFEEALSEILLAEFALVVTETELPDLSGMDL